MVTMRKDDIKIIAIDYHRNGVSGNGFSVVLFKWRDGDARKTRNMHAVLFEERGSCAVLDTDETQQGNIAFARGNSWRGDHFESRLRAALKARNDAIDETYWALTLIREAKEQVTDTDVLLTLTHASDHVRTHLSR